MPRNEFTLIKQYVSSAETHLKRADREWAYFKNGHPHARANDNDDHLVKSQKAYTAAKNCAEKALGLLRKTPDRDLENRARAVLNKCNQNK